MSAKCGNAIGAGSQRVGIVGDRVATRVEVKEGSEVDHQNQVRIRTTRHKNDLVGLNGHLRHLIGITLTSSKVVVLDEVVVVVVVELVVADKIRYQLSS